MFLPLFLSPRTFCIMKHGLCRNLKLTSFDRLFFLCHRISELSWSIATLPKARYSSCTFTIEITTCVIKILKQYRTKSSIKSWSLVVFQSIGFTVSFVLTNTSYFRTNARISIFPLIKILKVLHPSLIWCWGGSVTR